MDPILKRSLGPAGYGRRGRVRFLSRFSLGRFEMSLCPLITGFGNFGSFALYSFLVFNKLLYIIKILMIKFKNSNLASNRVFLTFSLKIPAFSLKVLNKRSRNRILFNGIIKRIIHSIFQIASYKMSKRKHIKQRFKHK